VYVTAEMQSSRLTSSVVADSALEIEWVHVGESMFTAALYNPPQPTYKLEVLLDYIEASVTELSHDFLLAEIVVAGDVNQLSDRDMVVRTGLTQIVCQPTRGANTLDSPQLFNTVRVVASVIKSDHKAVVAFPDSMRRMPKTHRQHVYRRHTPAQHAEFLQHAASKDLTNPPVPTQRSTHRQNSTIFIRSQCKCSTSTTRSKSSL